MILEGRKAFKRVLNDSRVSLLNAKRVKLKKITGAPTFKPLFTHHLHALGKRKKKNEQSQKLERVM